VSYLTIVWLLPHARLVSIGARILPRTAGAL